MAGVPDTAWIPLPMVFILSSIGNSGSNIFYDAFLVDVTPRKRMDMVSSIGFAAGYLGNILAFAICMSIVILASMKTIPISVLTACKISFIITAIWCALFSLPMTRLPWKNNILVNKFLRPVVNLNTLSQVFFSINIFE